MIKNIVNSFFRLGSQKSSESVKSINEFEFEVELAGHCNLNCWGCNHFSPLIDHELLDTKEYERDCQRLGELFSNTAKDIKLLGGEPLLNKEIKDIIEITRQNFPKSKIEIITNGILIKSMNTDFWECCRKNKISINITKYPVNLDYDEIEQIIKQNHIDIRYGNPNGHVMKKQSKFTLDESGKQNKIDSFRLCNEANECHTLKHGKLYTCSIAPYAERLNLKFDKKLKISDEDGIDIYRAQSAKEILEFLARPIPFCAYCDVNHRKRAHYPWKVSEKNMNEWIKDDNNEE